MQQTIQLGQVQPSILSRVERTVKNWRVRFDRAVEQSQFCQIAGFTPWHFSLQGLAFTALFGLLVMLVCGLPELLGNVACGIIRMVEGGGL